MTRAIIRKDRIIKLTINPKLGIEVGELPKGVGLERLRWDGKKIVDLNDLDTFFVNRATGSLHVNKQPNSEQVKMKYQDRFNLVKDPETNLIRIKTKEESDQPKKEEYRNRRKKDYPTLGDQMGAIIKYLKTLPNLPVELDQIIKNVDKVKVAWPKQ
jgi:hypothetical protein